MKNILLILIILSAFLIISCRQNSSVHTEASSQWESLFNGKDLTGWTPKIAGYPSGENAMNTFRVEDGAITVSYEQYDTFTNQYGHLFYKEELSNYHLRMKYRFIGNQVPGGQGWAFKNSGVMYHGENPDSMGLDQGFPVSLEGQFLGGNGTDERPTGNLCTPGMHVYINDTLVTDHCISSTSETIHDDRWVEFELIVKGNDEIHHIVNGDTVLSFSKPEYGGRFLPKRSFYLTGKAVTSGTISLQSESHPIQFKDIEILRLKK